MQRALGKVGVGRKGFLKRRAPGALLALPLLVCIWAGCSVEKHYEMLSFFFDGVPDPFAPLGAGLGSGGQRMPGVKYFTHDPFAQNACLECHRSPSQFSMSWEDSSMCLRCHEDIKSGYAYLHGPVAGDACLWCHAPHESTIRPLLRVGGAELCLQCHGLEMESAPPIPEHEDLARDCMDCHHAHGGDDRFFMRDTAELPAAAGEETPKAETDESANG